VVRGCWVAGGRRALGRRWSKGASSEGTWSLVAGSEGAESSLVGGRRVASHRRSPVVTSCPQFVAGLWVVGSEGTSLRREVGMVREDRKFGYGVACGRAGGPA
jgi:hypothetical protein